MQQRRRIRIRRGQVKLLWAQNVSVPHLSFIVVGRCTSISASYLFYINLNFISTESFRDKTASAKCEIENFSQIKASKLRIRVAWKRQSARIGCLSAGTKTQPVPHVIAPSCLRAMEYIPRRTPGIQVADRRYRKAGIFKMFKLFDCFFYAACICCNLLPR